MRAVWCTMAWMRSSGMRTMPVGWLSVPLQQFDESDPLALWDSQDRHPYGFTMFGQI